MNNSVECNQNVLINNVAKSMFDSLFLVSKHMVNRLVLTWQKFGFEK